MLLAIVQEKPELSIYANLLKELFKATNSVYVTGKEDVRIAIKKPAR